MTIEELTLRVERLEEETARSMRVMGPMLQHARARVAYEKAESAMRIARKEGRELVVTRNNTALIEAVAAQKMCEALVEEFGH